MHKIFAVMVGVALAGLFAAMGTGLSGMGAIDPSGLDAHRRFALGGSILVVMVHSLVFVYMIGTGRAIKDAVRDHGIEARYYEIHKRYKWQAAPWALSCATLGVATPVLGGVAESAMAGTWLHPLLAVISLVANFFGLPAEYRTIKENGKLLDKVAEVTAEVNRDKIERGEDPAPPLSPLTPAGWNLVWAGSAWLPWLYIRFVMGRSDLTPWPFALISAFALFGWFRNRGPLVSPTAEDPPAGEGS
ncbi:MAG: hypothetical protein DWQ01_10785 [Planctomycetota bacterium]|nr:MAG: hypothetical protein DWQ01_10785 [Planctomycetota bacterium]